MRKMIAMILLLPISSCQIKTKPKDINNDSTAVPVVPKNTDETILGDNIPGDQVPKIVLTIRENVKRINSIQHWSDTSTIDLETSTEGGEASLYYANGNLEKILAHEYGETFQHYTEFYLLDKKLSFVYEKHYQYNRPIYYDSATMKEAGDTEVFDFKKSVVTVQRTYFDGKTSLHIGKEQEDIMDRTDRIKRLTELYDDIVKKSR